MRMEVNTSSSVFPSPQTSSSVKRPVGKTKLEPVRSPFDTSWWLPPINNNANRPKRLTLPAKPILDEKCSDERHRQVALEGLKEESERERMEAEEAISRGPLFMLLRNRAIKKKRGKVARDGSDMRNIVAICLLQVLSRILLLFL